MATHPNDSPDSAQSWSVTHALTAPDRAAMAAMRPMVEPHKGQLRGVAARGAFDAIMLRIGAPEGVTFRAATVGGVAGWWCIPAGARSGHAILHLHGGWFNWGSAEAYRHLVGHIARSAGLEAFVPDYRLAPEHPFPAALDDALACYRALDASGKRVALSGDSAGGNLALVLLATASASPKSRAPTAAVALSPITDLAMTGASWQTRAATDPYFVREQATGLIGSYLNGAEATDPKASPLYANLVGLPPLRVHVGEDEVLLDDSVRFVERAAAAGVDARVDVWQGMPHGFPGGIGQLEAATQALALIGGFLAAQANAAAKP